jgi:hypothetical protein
MAIIDAICAQMRPPRLSLRRERDQGKTSPGWLVVLLVVCLGILVTINALRRESPAYRQTPSPGPHYQNTGVPSQPWSIHVVRVPRQSREFEWVTKHAAETAIGLTPLTDQIASCNSSCIPIAAINGGFYQREGPYAGDALGLQIVNGELISSPNGGAAFWVDALGQPHTGQVESQLRVIWPDGSSAPIGLNESRPPDRIVLYTPALGPSTKTREGLELVLVPQNNLPGAGLRPGRTYRARVREIHPSGNCSVEPETFVLSVGTALVTNLPKIGPGSELTISTATQPTLRGVKTAIGGGPVLVRRGKPLRIRVPDSDAYEFTSMTERHPRSAVGWNNDHVFIVAVDGRHPGMSEGMTLRELGKYLVKLGCQEAMNLDGGGSSTLWFDGRIRNYLCDGYERDVANSLLVCRKAGADGKRMGPASIPMIGNNP